MEDLNNLDDSDILTEENQDLHIGEEINNQPTDEDLEVETDKADQEDADRDEEGGEDKKPTPDEKRNHAFKKLKTQRKELRDENAQLRRELAKLNNAQRIDPMSNYDPKKFTPQQWRQLQIREGVKAEMANESIQAKQEELQVKEDALFAEEFELKKQEFLTNEAPDYDEVMNKVKDYKIPDEAVGFIQDADNPPRIAYFLAKNTHIADKLHDMNPKQMEKFIDRIDVKLDLESQRKAEVSRAKKTPSTRGKGGSISKDPSTMNMEEFAKWHRSKK